MFNSIAEERAYLFARLRELEESKEGGKVIINFSHPLSARNINDIYPNEVINLINIPVQINQSGGAKPLMEQIVDIMKSPYLKDVPWETGDYIINLPAYSPAAALILSYIHGLSGHFPRFIYLLKDSEGFNVKEICHPDALRSEARKERN